MCGIFGIFYKDQNTIADDKRLAKTAELISHRGPDYSGIYSQPGVGLVHTRLSLVDLNPRSNQPFWDKTGRFGLVYNGEIYNYQAIKSRLAAEGVSFSTNSDTEVLLYALIHYGVDALSEFEGMFAFGLYDKQDGSLLIARDRFGIKPLYYHAAHDSFIIASEQDAFSAWIEPELDYLSISSYLQGGGGPHQSRTFYRAISSLPPGTWAKVEGGVCSEPQSYFALADFWNPAYHEDLNRCSDLQIVDKMEELLFSSVEKHMLADAPVGALCSGGVDSSIILSMAAKVTDNLEIFHADVVGRNSERGAAEMLASHLKLNLNVVEVKDDDFIEGIPRVTRHYGQPFIYHPNSVPFLAVTDLVRANNVKAILTGEAADECYLGYSYLPTEDFFAQYHRLLSRLGALVKRIPHLDRILFPENLKDNSLSMNLHNRFEQGYELATNIDAVMAKNSGSVNSKDLKTLRMLAYHLRSLLHRNDSLGMASSIEARFPFLDHQLIEFAVNLPYRFKVRRTLSAAREKKHPFLVSKWVVRQVADRYLPKALSQRPKQGFPTDAFERMKINPDLFQGSFVSEIFGLSKGETNYMGGISSEEFKLRLMLLDVWGRVNVQRQPVDEVAADLKRYITI